MSEVLANIQEQSKPVDTTETVPMIKLLPSEKIKSEDGAMIPNEVLYMTKIQPALPVEKKSNPAIPCYVMAGVVVLVIIICTKIILNRINTLSK